MTSYVEDPPQDEFERNFLDSLLADYLNAINRKSSLEERLDMMRETLPFPHDQSIYLQRELESVINELADIAWLFTNNGFRNH